MDVWPGSSKGGTTGRKKGKVVHEGSTSKQIYPTLNHGSIGAGTLVKDGETYEWKTVTGLAKAAVHVTTRRTCVFPATRPPEIAKPKYTLKQRAEQGVRFLRTHHPDVDIPFDVVKEEIAEDDRVDSTLRDFDPTYGDTLATLYNSGGPNKRAAFVAFPTGELRNELNISKVAFKKDELLFKPTAKPIWVFDSPIRQISTSYPSVSFEDVGGHHMAVRSYGQITTFDISQLPNFHNNLAELQTIHPADVLGEAIVDMDFGSRFSSDLNMISQRGNIFSASALNGINCVARIPPEEDSKNEIWKLIRGNRYDQMFVSSESTVYSFDLRVGNEFTTLYRIADGPNIVTSIAAAGADENVLCVTTTDEVVWVDNRQTRNPLLAWKHHRERDKTLHAKNLSMKDAHLGILGSRHNGHLTLFSTSSYKDGKHPLQFEQAPMSLPLSYLGTSPFSRTLFAHPWKDSFSVLELSDLGALYHTELRYHDRRGVIHDWDDDEGRLRLIWTSDVRNLADVAGDLRSAAGKFSHREYMVADMSQLYKKLFKDDLEENRQHEEDNPDAVYDVLEAMSSYWQHGDDGLESVKTLFDVAYGSGDDPRHEARSDFLTGSSLNCVRGWRALRQSKLPLDDLARTSAWHADLSQSLRKMDSEAFPQGLDDVVTDFTVERSSENQEAKRRETEDHEQVTLDLALSRHVYSTVSLDRSEKIEKEPADEEDAAGLSRAAQGLSLSQEDPKPVSFSYLRPTHTDPLRFKRKRKMNDEATAVPDDDELILPMGVRLLLSEWERGTKVEDYVFVDPYGLDDALRPTSQQPRGQRKKGDKSAQESSESDEEEAPVTRAPPTIIAAKTLTATQPVPAITEFSQPTFTGRAFAQTQSESQLTTGSQMPMASTQVLPGPFGGRPGMAKKKPVKKRVGGF